MNCDLCGSPIEMRESGPVCTGCGMQYSMEALRKKLGNPTSAPAAAPTAPSVSQQPKDNIADLLVQAELALGHGSAEGAMAFCNTILALDPTNEKGWQLKLKAALRSNACGAALVLSTAASRFGIDAPLYLSLREKVLPCACFTKLSFSAAQQLADFDPDFARTFADRCLEGFMEKKPEYYRKGLLALQNCYKRGKTDQGWRNLLDREWRLQQQSIGDDLSILEHAVQTCGNILDRAASYPPIVRLIQSHLAEAREMLPSEKSIPSLSARIAPLAAQADAIEQAARQARLATYWAARPGVKEALQQEAAQQEAQRAAYSDELKPLNEQDTALKKDLAALKKKLSQPVEAQSELDHFDHRIAELTNTINSLNIFQGKRRKELQAELADVTQTRAQIAAKVREQTAQRDSRVTARMDEIKAQIGALSSKIGTLRRRIADCSARLIEIEKELNPEF